MKETIEIDKTMLAEYAKLKQVEKATADRLKELQPTIREAMRANDVDKVNTDFGSFTLSSRATWEFSDAVDELKEKEKANGTAKQIVATVLSFRASKVKS
jgi:hypothetical protein